jgi:hypothetical protein
MRAVRLICDVRYKGETCGRRETREARDVSEGADTAAGRAHGVMIDAQGGANRVGIGNDLRAAQNVSSL